MFALLPGKRPTSKLLGGVVPICWGKRAVKFESVQKVCRAGFLGGVAEAITYRWSTSDLGIAEAIRLWDSSRKKRCISTIEVCCRGDVRIFCVSVPERFLRIPGGIVGHYT